MHQTEWSLKKSGILVSNIILTFSFYTSAFVFIAGFFFFSLPFVIKNIEGFLSRQ